MTVLRAIFALAYATNRDLTKKYVSQLVTRSQISAEFDTEDIYPMFLIGLENKQNAIYFVRRHYTMLFVRDSAPCLTRKIDSKEVYL